MALNVGNVTIKKLKVISGGKTIECNKGFVDDKLVFSAEDQIYPGASVTTMFTSNTGVISGFKISRAANQEGYGMCYIPIDLTDYDTLTIKGSLQSFTGMCLSDKLPQANANPGALSVASQNSDTGYKHDSIWYKNNWPDGTDVITVTVDGPITVTNYKGTYYLILALYGSHIGVAATEAEITSVIGE